MRRVFVAATLCAAFLLLAAPAFAAPRHSAPGTGLQAHASSLSHGQAAPRGFVPLARRLLSGTGTISLNLYAWSGAAEEGSTVSWYVFGDADYGTGTSTTDTAGHVTMTGVPAADSDNGKITVDSAAGDDGWYDLTKMSWPASGTDMGLQAGRLPVTLVRGGSSLDGWNSWTAARVWLWAHKNTGNEVHLAASNITSSGTYTNGYARTIQTGPEELYQGAAYFWDNEGVELSVGGIGVAPGQTVASGPTADETQAQRVWTDGWGSGKPGSVAKVVMNNYQAGWVDAIYGVADYPATARMKSFGTYTHNGADINKKAITIPSTAAPGYAYWIEVDHTTGPLDLWAAFQVCTLKPSRTTVSAGTAISLSGIVPIQGHYGSKKGTPKYVTLYKTTSARTARTQPMYYGGRTVKGWTKVARVRTDGLGKYKLSNRPSKTTWYCTWYPGDDWYWGAWTSVAKVAVR